MFQKKRDVPLKYASRPSLSAIRPQLLILVTQGLQDFFALVLGNFPAALFSQVSHDRSLYFFVCVISEHLRNVSHFSVFSSIVSFFFSNHVQIFCIFFKKTLSEKKKTGSRNK